MLKSKVVFVGNSNVGKTSLVTSLLFNTNISDTNADETDSTLPTIGGAYHRKRDYYLDKEIVMEFWDTAGQERFHSIAPIYFRGANIGIFVLDVSDPLSFEGLCVWKTIYDNVVIPCNNNYCILVGNKSDKKICVTDNDVISFMQTHNIQHYVKTSAANGLGVHDLYNKIKEYVVLHNNDITEPPELAFVGKIMDTNSSCASKCY